jgi:hypothetical protein
MQQRLLWPIETDWKTYNLQYVVQVNDYCITCVWTPISKMWESWFGLVNETMFGSETQAKYDHVMLRTPYQPISIHCKAGSTLSISLPAWPAITSNMWSWYVITVRIPYLAELYKLFTRFVSYYQFLNNLAYRYNQYVKLICYYHKNARLGSDWQAIH